LLFSLCALLVVWLHYLAAQVYTQALTLAGAAAQHYYDTHTWACRVDWISGLINWIKAIPFKSTCQEDPA